MLIHRIANLIQYGRGADTDEVPEWATEEDLALRGPGDFLGSRQHGLPLLKVASLQMDLETLQDAQQAAAAVIQTADSLNAPELAPLKGRVEALFTRQEVSLN